MGVFIVSYDAHLMRDYDDLYKAMEEHDGIRLLESMWGIELNNTVGEVRDWVHGLLDDDDSIVIIQIKPKPSWATRQVSKDINQWFKDSF